MSVHDFDGRVRFGDVPLGSVDAFVRALRQFNDPSGHAGATVVAGNCRIRYRGAQDDGNVFRQCAGPSG